MIKLPLETDEKIIMTCHKHWLSYLGEGSLLFLLLLLPYGAYRLLGISIDTTLSSQALNIATFFYVAWFLLLWSYFFIAWTNIYLDEWIITDRRIIDIEQVSLFHRQMSDFRIEKIQNITVEEGGLLASMLGFGSIHVETAGETERLRFDMLPHPFRVRDLISECHDKCLARLQRPDEIAE